ARLATGAVVVAPREPVGVGAGAWGAHAHAVRARLAGAAGDAAPTAVAVVGRCIGLTTGQVVVAVGEAGVARAYPAYPTHAGRRAVGHRGAVQGLLPVVDRAVAVVVEVVAHLGRRLHILVAHDHAI